MKNVFVARAGNVSRKECEGIN
jgi:hypothetical protein